MKMKFGELATFIVTLRQVALIESEFHRLDAMIECNTITESGEQIISK